MSTNQPGDQQDQNTVPDSFAPTDALTDEVKASAVDASGQLDGVEGVEDGVGADQARAAEHARAAGGSDGSEGGAADVDDEDDVRATGYEGA